jgi:Flp pilus assembly protein TadG
MSKASFASERGAVLIQTAIAVTVLVGFGTFVADYGVLWIARHQAQNAADAGAMAGAIARAYDDFDDPPVAGGVADQNASQIAAANPVWGAPSTPVTSFACPADVVAVEPNSRCVRVDAHRDGDFGSTALRTWFGPIFGISSQGVQATATAKVLIPNATDCLRPWAIPDTWVEGTPGSPDFQKYDALGALLTPHDDYTPPSTLGPGSGLRFPISNGDRLAALGSAIGFAFADIRLPANPILASSIVPLEMTGGYDPSLAGCNGQLVAIGNQITVSDDVIADTDFRALRDQDPTASWNAATNTIDMSCAPGCAPISPRLVAVAVFDVDVFQYRKARGDWSMCPPASVSCLPCPGGPASPCVSIVNIVGLFVMDALPSVRVASYPGIISTDPPRLRPESSFLKAVTLVR